MKFSPRGFIAVSRSSYDRDGVEDAVENRLNAKLMLHRTKAETESEGRSLLDKRRVICKSETTLSFNSE